MENQIRNLRRLLQTSEENERLLQLQNQTLKEELKEIQRAVKRENNHQTNLL
jgi:hypothetical protein